MSQMTWTYVADDGSRHRVGLFHGDQTGHLLVYCNTRIVVIDFEVRESKNYSFFINEELLDIEVEELNGKFSYGLTIDQKSDTPRNRIRRKMTRQQVRQTLLLVGLFLILVTISVFIITR